VCRTGCSSTTDTRVDYRPCGAQDDRGGGSGRQGAAGQVSQKLEQRDAVHKLEAAVLDALLELEDWRRRLAHSEDDITALCARLAASMLAQTAPGSMTRTVALRRTVAHLREQVDKLKTGGRCREDRCGAEGL
jgi:hypothetical protein